jgi:hypothetical protein
MRPLYPVTIVRTRYGGVYEGGEWAAFFCEPQTVPEAAFGDDVECADWWALAKEGEIEIEDWYAAIRPRDERPNPSRRLYVAARESPNAALEALDALVPAEDRR